MELHPYVHQVQAHLVATAALGDERTQQTAAALTAATEPAMRLAILAAVSSVADEITAALLDVPGAPAVSVRLDGDQLRVDVTSSGPDSAPAPAEDADASARISLRLSEMLKSDIEAAARADATSVNAWLLRAAATALSAAAVGRRGPNPIGGRRHGAGNDAHRITGWING